MKLYIIPLGACDVDKGAVLTPGSGDGERIVIPIVAYLIETDDGRHILVDSGMHRKHIADPESSFRGTEFARYLTPIMRSEDDIINRLAELSLGLDDIDILVATHFHFDHAGNNSDFGASRVMVQRSAYEFAVNNPDAVMGDMWNHSHLQYEMIDGNLEIAPGVTLLESSGHTPGHMSVLVQLPETGAVLLAIDAIYTRETLESEIWGGYHDPGTAKASADRLVAIAKRENALLIFGHDREQWATVHKSPEFYA